MPISDEDVKGSEARLWHLVELRAQPGSDVKAIDQRIWDLFGEDWAVMFTDLSGFSRQVATFGICHFLQVIHEQKRILFPIIAEHDGILIKVEADSFLIIFKKAARAVTCAVAMQHACQKHSARRLPEEQVLLCVGIGHGRVLRIGDHDIYGAEVNAASKLGEDTAKANDILVTRGVREQIDPTPGWTFEPVNAQIPGTDACFKVGYEQFRP